MLRVALVVALLLVVPATAHAQFAWPSGTFGGQPLSPGSGCLTAGNTGLCGDAPIPDRSQLPPVSAAPGSALAVTFDEPVATVTGGDGVGALTQVDATTWTFTLAPAAVGSQLVQLLATFNGPRVTGSAAFNAHVAVTSATVHDPRLTRSVVRARVAVPARGTIRAHVVVRGQRRSAVVTRSFSAAGERRLRLNVRRGKAGTAWLVVRYTFPGAKPVEISQRLSA